MKFLSLIFSVYLSISFLSSPSLIYVSAQDSNSNSTNSSSTFDVKKFTSALKSAGFTQLANAAKLLNDMQTGQQLFAQLSTGNYTLFAPTDKAFANISTYTVQNSEDVARYLSYHFVHGDLRNTSYVNSTAGGGGTSSSSSMSSTSSSSSTSSFSSSESSTSSAQTTETATSSAPGTGAGLPSGGETSAVTTATPIQSMLYNVFSRPVLDDTGGGGSSNGSNAQLLSSIYPNVTLGRTLLNSSEWVKLPYQEPQVVAWARPSEDGNVTIVNQISNSTVLGLQNITVVNSTQYENIFINGIDGVLTPPLPLSQVLTAINATQFQGLLLRVPATTPGQNSSGNSSGTMLDRFQNTSGVTVFVPDSGAFDAADAQGLFGPSINGNDTALGVLVANQFVGDVVYSPQMWQLALGSSQNQSQGQNQSQLVSRDGSQNLTTWSGQPIQFQGNDSGLYVSGGNGTSAKIVRSDILVENGVVHVVDRVLFDQQVNEQAVSSIMQSASSAASASASTTDTGIIIASMTSSAAQQSSSSPSSSSSSSESGSSPSSASSTSESSSSSSESTSSESTSSSTSTETTSTAATPTSSTFEHHHHWYDRHH